MGIFRFCSGLCLALCCVLLLLLAFWFFFVPVAVLFWIFDDGWGQGRVLCRVLRAVVGLGGVCQAVDFLCCGSCAVLCGASSPLLKDAALLHVYPMCMCVFWHAAWKRHTR